jgi:hypothetical protein
MDQSDISLEHLWKDLPKSIHREVDKLKKAGTRAEVRTF